MNIREALIAEHSRRQTMKIVNYVGDDPAKFRELMSVFFEGEYRLTQRAAWPMNYCAQLHPEMIKPYLSRLVAQLRRDDVHDAVRRNVTRLLQFVEIPKSLQGKVYSLCFDLVNDIDEPAAVRVFALTVATRIAKSQPDLVNELRQVVKMHLPHSSVAFRKRAREILSA